MDKRIAARIEKATTRDKENSLTEIVKRLGENLYGGVRRFIGGTEKNVVVEMFRYNSSSELEEIKGRVKARDEVAKNLGNTTIQSLHNDPRFAYVVSGSDHHTLKELLSRTDLSKNERGNLAYQVCNLVKKLHSQSQNHLNLTLERIVIDKDNRLRVLTNHTNMMQPGVRDFIPEEIIANMSEMDNGEVKQRYDRNSIDTFLTGLMVYEILTGKKPSELKEYKLIRNIFSDESYRMVSEDFEDRPGSWWNDKVKFRFDDINKQIDLGERELSLEIPEGEEKIYQELLENSEDFEAPDTDEYKSDEFFRTLTYGRKVGKHLGAVLDKDMMNKYFGHRGRYNRIDFGLLMLTRRKKRHSPDIDFILDPLKKFGKKRYKKSLEKKIAKTFKQEEGEDYSLIEDYRRKVFQKKTQRKMKIGGSILAAAILVYALNAVVPKVLPEKHKKKFEEFTKPKIEFVKEGVSDFSAYLFKALSKVTPTLDGGMERRDDVDSVYVLGKEDLVPLGIEYTNPDVSVRCTDNDFFYDPVENILIVKDRVKLEKGTNLVEFEAKDVNGDKEEFVVRLYNKDGSDKIIKGKKSRKKGRKKSKKAEVKGHNVSRDGYITETAGKSLCDILRGTKYSNKYVHIRYKNKINIFSKIGGKYYKGDRRAKLGIDYGKWAKIITGAYAREVNDRVYQLNNVGSKHLGEVYLGKKRIMANYGSMFIYECRTGKIRSLEKNMQNGRFYEKRFILDDKYIPVYSGDMISKNEGRLRAAVSRMKLPLKN